jgi:hypothetical protein
MGAGKILDSWKELPNSSDVYRHPLHHGDDFSTVGRDNGGNSRHAFCAVSCDEDGIRARLAEHISERSMKLPKRPEEHITETTSWRLLQSLAPREWILRDISERDYGIDCYIELSSKTGEITGELMSVQLKGTERLGWTNDGTDKTARSPSIKTSTAAYWLRLPVPVFLFVADLSEENIYYVSVEESIRSQYGKMDDQATIRFTLRGEQSLKSPIGLLSLLRFYKRERAHEQFSFHMMNLLSHVEMFSDYILEHQNRDTFMEVEGDAHLQFRALYESCQMASLYLKHEWPLESLNELYAKDRAEWNDEFVSLHEKSLDYALQKIQEIFPALVRKALTLVTERQFSYWMSKDPVFFSLCDANSTVKWALDRLERHSPA